ncbi:type III PLP-dependent enzyme [Actinocrispum wychmicini]|uniref:Diaminopimelate decarboxylase n=1 Tax=Actinocrispum wychmicini TaxID=1213861 RepID=A0A4R2JR68_9PSEU|nr:type III PLP-dependent enzyme [Actinocrispum wychmicini]TCO59319.1 diaminopimelate decarboxylase [Actinocrispum wychmicini]
MSLSNDQLLVLAARLGTPLYTYDLARVRSAAALLRTELPADARVFYSLKANPHPGIVAACLAEGLGVEVSSEGEWSSIPDGTPATSVIYSGPGKTRGQLTDFAKRWDGYVTVESFRELAEVRAVGGFAGILLRVNITSAHTGASLTMSGRPSQFGIDDADLMSAWSTHDLGAGDVVGFQVYAMSNQTDVRILAATAGEALQFVREMTRRFGFRPAIVDLGGGFPAPFGRPGVLGLAGLRAALLTELAAAPTDAQLVFESGRFLSATAGSLYARVLDVKSSKGREYVVLDAGVNCVAGLQASGRTLPVPVGIEVVHRCSQAGRQRPMTVTGPLCTPFDVLNREILLDVMPGDLVRVPNVGAYGLSASAVGFLSRRLPAEVVVDGAKVIGATRVTMVRGGCG